MKIGDAVVYLADRDLYGLGRYIANDDTNKRLIVEFADGYIETFHSTELETSTRANLTRESMLP